MKIKLRSLLILTALLAGAFGVCPLVSAQTDISPSPTAASIAQPAASPQMQGMDKMSDSVTKMSEMCQMMMKKEMAGAPYKMAAGVAIGILLLIALVLFIILEVQWMIYWKRLLGAPRQDDRARSADPE